METFVTEIYEGYLFAYISSLQYPQEALGSFQYKDQIINVIGTKGKTIEEVRKIATEQVDPKNEDAIMLEAKKIAYMSQKKYEILPISVEILEGNELGILFHSNKDREDLDIFARRKEEKTIYFYIPAP